MTKKKKQATQLGAPNLSGRVWAAWAFKSRAEALRAAKFLNTTPEGTEFPISTGTYDKATRAGSEEGSDIGDGFDTQAEGWNTDEAGAKADVYQADGPAPWRMVWSVLAEPQLTETLEGAEKAQGEEALLWLSPFSLSEAMEDAGLEPVEALDPKDGRVTDEAYDFGQPPRVRPYQGPKTQILSPLESAAQRVLDAWEGGDLAAAVRGLQAAMDEKRAQGLGESASVGGIHV